MNRISKITPNLPYGYKIGMTLIFAVKPALEGDLVYIKGFRYPRKVVETYLETFMIMHHGKLTSIPWSELDTDDYNRCRVCGRNKG